MNSSGRKIKTIKKSSFDFEKEWKRGISRDELKTRTKEYFKSLPWKNGAILFFLLTFSLNSAQTIEQEIAKKSCECIQTKLSPDGKISNQDRQKCISKSGDEVLKSKDPQEVKRLTKNMDEVVERLKTIYKLVEKCLPKDNNFNQ